MTLMSWSGASAIVADGDEMVEVNCADLLAGTAPFDIVEQIDRMEFGLEEGRRVLCMVLSNDALDALNALPPRQMTVTVGGETLVCEAMALVHREDRERLELVWGVPGP
jgi:hypothetical protein